MKLKIKDWQIYFENCESKKLKRLSWVPVPNKTNGEGYTDLVDHPDGAAHLGAWLAIIEAASTKEPRENRGFLPDGDGTISGISRSLGRISRLPGRIFEEVIPRLLKIGWVEDLHAVQQHTATSGDSPEIPGDAPEVAVTKGREGNRREEEIPPTPNAPVGVLFEDAIPVKAVIPISRKSRSGKRTSEQIRKALGPERLVWWESFWSVYPCHEDPTRAMDKFERVVKEHGMAQEVYRGAKRYAAKMATKPDSTPKYAEGWLTDERWLDEIRPERIQAKNGTIHDGPEGSDGYRVLG